MKVICESSRSRLPEIDDLVPELVGKVIEVDTVRVRCKVVRVFGLMRTTALIFLRRTG